MNNEMKDILLVALGGAALFGGLYLSCLASEKYRKWRRKKDDEDYERWREKRRKMREERAARAEVKEETPSTPTGKSEATEKPEPTPPTQEDRSAIERSNADKIRLALAHDYADRAYAAYADGTGLVEAYFYAQLSKLNGGDPQLRTLTSQIRVAWRQMGYPDEKGLLHGDFGELESAMGRACLRIDSRREAERGVMCLTELAEGGNEFAKALMEARGLGEGPRQEH